jgi:hypothetical protein
LITDEKGVPVNVCEGTTPAFPTNVGTLAGHAIACAGTAAAEPVNTGGATVPTGVKAAVAFVPAGVTVFDPPVAPTSPLAAIVPSGIAPLNADTCCVPTGHDAFVVIVSVPMGYAPHGVCARICGKVSIPTTSIPPNMPEQNARQFMNVFSSNF